MTRHPSKAGLVSAASVPHGPNRVFDWRYDAFVVRVLPGSFYASGRNDEMIVTILGSCVAACVRDPVTGFGGMNHFMLPESASGNWNGIGAALRYGNFAMEALINAVLASGCRRQNLEIKLFGGANLLDGASTVGSMNAAFARNYLAAEGLAVSAYDLGGSSGRRIHYTPCTGKIQRLLLNDRNRDKIVAEDKKYKKAVMDDPVDGGIEMF